MTKAKKTTRTKQKPISLKKAWAVCITLLVVSLLAEVLNRAFMKVETVPFFYAWFGFVVNVVIICAAKLYGRFVKRPEKYYLREREIYGQ